MSKIKFEKISLKQWLKDFMIDGIDRETQEFFYDDIKIPCAQTKGSMCHDFFAPFSFKLEPKKSILIPTGIRFNTYGDYTYGLSIFPRSGLGVKGLRLINTVGKIDPDYCEAKNEGHILCALENTSDKTISVAKGKGFVQGEINTFTIINCEDTQRIGGYGSTDKEDK